MPSPRSSQPSPRAYDRLALFVSTLLVLPIPVTLLAVLAQASGA